MMLPVKTKENITTLKFHKVLKEYAGIIKNVEDDDKDIYQECRKWKEEDE